MRAVGGVQNAACVYDGKFTTFRLSGMKCFIPLLTAGRHDLRGYLCFPAALNSETLLSPPQKRHLRVGYAHLMVEH